MITHIDEVIHLIKRAKEGQGSLVIIEGGPRTGKTTQVQAIADCARQTEELANALFAFARCDQATTNLDAYQPFVEILSSLLRNDHPGRDGTPLIRTIIENSGPDLLRMIADIETLPSAIATSRRIMTGLGLGVGDDRRSAASVALSAQWEK